MWRKVKVNALWSQANKKEMIRSRLREIENPFIPSASSVKTELECTRHSHIYQIQTLPNWNTTSFKKTREQSSKKHKKKQFTLANYNNRHPRSASVIRSINFECVTQTHGSETALSPNEEDQHLKFPYTVILLSGTSAHPRQIKTIS